MADLKLHILDVGMGDGCFVELPGGGKILVDLGSTKNKKIAWPSISKFFADKYKGKIELDLLVVTHGDRDHFNMIKDFLDSHVSQLNAIALGGVNEDFDSAAGKKFFTAWASRKPNVLFAPDKWGTVPLPPQRVGGATLTWCCNRQLNGKNDRSLIMRLEYEQESILLTGDATRASQSWLLGQSHDQLDCTVLKIAHHGSARTSGSEAWFKATDPEFAFISSDRHGSSDYDKSYQSGHRLPQQVLVDAVLAWGSLQGADEHVIVTHYDPSDYTGLSQANREALHAVRPMNTNPGWNTAGWKDPRTNRAIFTTLVEMDRKYPDDNREYDIGTQYEVVISKGGSVNVLSAESSASQVQGIKFGSSEFVVSGESNGTLAGSSSQVADKTKMEVE